MSVVRYKITGGWTWVDEESIPLLEPITWAKVKSRRTFYARGGITVGGVRTTINMQRLIMGSPAGVVDHIDRNGLHNWKTNFRVLTNFENLQNCEGRGGASKFKGVSIHYTRRDGHKSWRATIAGEHIGLYETEEEAAAAYDAAALKRFGPAAYMNLGVRSEEAMHRV